MSQATYAAPLDHLLALGTPQPWDLWLEYSTLGLRREHVPELIRMATDPVLLDAPADDARVWAPLHAWRALGQFMAVEAIEPLLSLLPRIEDNDDDAIGEDVPQVFGRIGIAALQPLRQYVADPQQLTFARVAAVEGIKHIGMNPQHREACAAALAELLDRPDMTDETVNAFIVIGLCELHAKRHVEVIERAFRDRRVDGQMCGNLTGVRAELGLSPARPTSRATHPDLLIEMAIDKVLPPSPAEPEPQWVKEFLG